MSFGFQLFFVVLVNIAEISRHGNQKKYIGKIKEGPTYELTAPVAV
jgi:hypothetical protein